MFHISNLFNTLLHIFYLYGQFYFLYIYKLRVSGVYLHRTLVLSRKCTKFLFGLFHLSFCYLVYWPRFAIATYPSPSYMLKFVFQYALHAVANLGCNCTLSILQNFVSGLDDTKFWSICNCRVGPSLLALDACLLTSTPSTVNVYSGYSLALRRNVTSCYDVKQMVIHCIVYIVIFLL